MQLDSIFNLPRLSHGRRRVVYERMRAIAQKGDAWMIELLDQIAEQDEALSETEARYRLADEPANPKEI